MHPFEDAVAALIAKVHAARDAATHLAAGKDLTYANIPQ